MLSLTDTPRGEPSDAAILLTAEQAARLLNVSRSRIYEWIQSGELPSVTLGRSRRITRSALERFVAEREAASA